jgi:hypothetical protein
MARVRPRPKLANLVLAAMLAVVVFAGCTDDDEPEPRTGETSPTAASPARKPKGGDNADGKSDGSPGQPKVDPPPGFEAIPDKAWARCSAGAPLAGACPTIVPKTKRNYLVESFGRPGGRFGVLELSSGAQRDAPEANAPPAFGHLVLEAGGPRFLIDFGAAVTTATLSDDLIREPRSGTVLLGPRRWGKRKGRLLLAEPFPGGGAHGGHLVFQWRRRAVIHRVSLHAWVPAGKAEAALEKIVRSMR